MFTWLDKQSVVSPKCYEKFRCYLPRFHSAIRAVNKKIFIFNFRGNSLINAAKKRGQSNGSMQNLRFQKTNTKYKFLTHLKIYSKDKYQKELQKKHILGIKRNIIAQETYKF